MTTAKNLSCLRPSVRFTTILTPGSLCPSASFTLEFFMVIALGNATERLQGHPCQLPEALLERVVHCSTRPGDMVLDPMAGTGTTLRVAQRLGRRYLGIEKEAPFVALIKDRLAKERQQELFLQ